MIILQAILYYLFFGGNKTWLIDLSTLSCTDGSLEVAK